MGKLLFMSDLHESANWYVKDAYYESRSGDVFARWHFAWPNSAYPCRVAIHQDDMADNKPDIRKWIERSDVGTVVYDQIDNSYRVWWSTDPAKRDWDSTSEIKNKWELFHFEDSESALAFNLRFSDLVKPVTNDHPTRHYGERYHH